MEPILAAHDSLEKKSNLSKTVNDVQTLINQLQATRDAIASNPDLTPLHIAKLKQPVKQTFDKIEEDLKEVNKGLNQYQKALKERFKGAQSLPGGGGIEGQESGGLVERAVAIHLLREGMFGVAGTFVSEVNETQRRRGATDGTGDLSQDSLMQDFLDSAEPMMMDSDEQQEEDGELLEGRGHLRRKFAEMHYILHALRDEHTLGPAIAWARDHSLELEQRGSNLEFELSRLKFVELYASETSDDVSEDSYPAFFGPVKALEYARTVFPTFSSRYSRETSTLLGSLAFSPSLDSSPYKTLFYNQSSWEDVSISFTKEFTSLLNLPSTSPLYTAVTAGSIALPILEKVERIMAASRGQWTSVNELPVETPLPPAMAFHSIFVCPVSKEQATDANPPMMMPCGHVICRESLEMHARGKSRVKCPYCPGESQPREARRVYI